MQAEENGVSLREAATRVFSNASGSYSSNVNLAVENSSWSDEQQLQEMYLKRKSFAFNSDRFAMLLILCTSLLGLRYSVKVADNAPTDCLQHDSGCEQGRPAFSKQAAPSEDSEERGSCLHRRCSSPSAALNVGQGR